MAKPQQNISIKIVFYGPAQSGKTTNLINLHNRLRPELKNDIMILDTKDDRTLFFDLLPVGFYTPSGSLITIKLYTVPGQVIHDSSRKAILMNADAVVFVADSQISQNRNNAESFLNLEHNLALVGLEIKNIPLVIQFNKIDLENIISRKAVLSKWEKAPWPIHFSSALNGKGVLETFLTVIRVLYRHLNECHDFENEHGVSESYFVTKIFKGLT